MVSNNLLKNIKFKYILLALFKCFLTKTHLTSFKMTKGFYYTAQKDQPGCAENISLNIINSYNFNTECQCRCVC